MLNRNLESSDDGVEKFYPSSPPPSNNASAGSTPLSGSPLLDGCASPLPCVSARSSLSGGGIFSHLKSSRSKNASKEDLTLNSASPSGTTERENDVGGIRKRSTFEGATSCVPQHDKMSPAPINKHHESNKHKHGGSGLSCLSGINDEDLPPPVPHVATKPSPDRKGVPAGTGTAPISPSMQSISDIFAKQASGKVTGKATGLSPGVSPFATRKTESPSSISEESFAERRSSLTNSQEGSKTEYTGSPETGGKKTPDGVIRRQGIGHGNNPDLMAEIKEKRASMVPKGTASDELSPCSKVDDEKEKCNSASNSNSSNVFGKVRLR